MIKISQKAGKLTTSPLYDFFRKVKEIEASGQKIISLGVGEPFQHTSERIKAAGIEAIRVNKTHYNPAVGSLALRKALAEKHGVSAEQVIVSSGAKPFLGAILWSMIDDGDVFYLAEPFYPPFKQIAESCGAKVVPIDTKYTNFQLSASNLNEIFSLNKNRNSFLILNSPNNPTGVVYDRLELDKIVDVCKKNNVTIISDECYSNFSPDKQFSMRDLDEDIVVINSLSKAYAMTGWRIGYAICPIGLVKVVGRFLENYIGCPCSISEEAALEALKQKPLDDYLQQRMLIHSWLEKMGISFVKSNGGFFVFPDFSNIIEKKELRDSTELAALFLEQAGVATTPGKSFGDKYDSYLRLSYCIEVKDLELALEKLEKIIA